MDVFIEEFVNIVKYTAVATGVIGLVGLLVYSLQKLTSRDLSDQTGWKNFARPAVGVLFVSVFVQIIVIVVATLSVT
ncbi:hypothetical protein JW796_03740 [Candidatus Dojkabacteria bacterium]|nr:hypothetical protein [Candidatus Dojkabacteria bacterium]